jgi:hypothetical protein
LDQEPNPDALTLMMFDGVRTHRRSKILSPGVLYGSNEDSGDGNGFDTIKLIPDAALDFDSERTNDQYIIIEPTGGEPGHVHIRSGGTMDQSSADLFLGGELNHVKVSDTNDTVIISTDAGGEGGHTWTFEKDAKLTFPNGGAIEPVGMGWMGVTNGTSGNPVSILNKNLDDNQRSILTLYNSDTYGTAEIITVYAPGIPDGGNINTATSTGNWDANPLIALSTTGGSGTGFTVDVNEPGSGYADFVTVVNPGSGYLDGETITVTSGEASATFVIDVQEYNRQWTFNETGITTLPGGIQGNVKSNTYVDTTIALDVNAAVNKIVPTTTAGGDKYSLADGIEGQIMYLVPATGGEQMNEYTEMSFAHARYTNGAGVINEGANVGGWLPFQNINTPSVILTLIFTDGHWNLPHNNFD